MTTTEKGSHQMFPRADIYWIAGVPGGRLGIMARPRAGEWLRDEIGAWANAGLQLVVSLLEESEVRELALNEEPALCAASGIDFVSFPIPDRGVPRSLPNTLKLVEMIDDHLRRDCRVAIHCRAGIGRSGLIAACVLAYGGVPLSEVFPSISKARGLTTPDTDAQVQWLSSFSGFSFTP